LHPICEEQVDPIKTNSFYNLYAPSRCARILQSSAFVRSELLPDQARVISQSTSTKNASSLKHELNDSPRSATNWERMTARANPWSEPSSCYFSLTEKAKVFR
jgi:hypothetical protein